jgi:DNA-binding CsgD family transcriptional regulator
MTDMAGGDGDVLTHGEQRIAVLAAQGRRNDEIAGELGLRPKTVEWNLTRIYRKLAVRSRTELAALLAADGDPRLGGRNR